MIWASCSTSSSQAWQCGTHSHNHVSLVTYATSLAIDDKYVDAYAYMKINTERSMCSHIFYMSSISQLKNDGMIAASRPNGYFFETQVGQVTDLND